MRVGYGFTRSRNGAANMHAVTCIPTVAGKWRHPGGGALYSNADLFPVDFTLIRGLDAMDKSTRVLDQARIGPILTGDPRDGTDRRPVKAMFIQNTNPMMVAPETTKVREGFLRDDLFVCVHEQFMTETAAMADIVLPATTFLEHDDIYLAGGHTYLQIARRVIEPLGECRSNHEVLCGLAERLGADHPGFRMTEWEMIDATLEASGLGDAEAAAEGRWIDCAKASEGMRFLDGFGHPDGRFRFRPDWSSVGRDAERMPALPDHFAIVDEADDERPFRLVTAPSRGYLNSSFTETPGSREREGRPTIKLHPRGPRSRRRLGRRPAAGRQPAGQHRRPRRGVRRPAARRGDRRRHLAQRRLRGRARRQRAGQRRARPAVRRCGLSRHRGVGAAGLRAAGPLRRVRARSRTAPPRYRRRGRGAATTHPERSGRRYCRAAGRENRAASSGGASPRPSP